MNNITSRANPLIKHVHSLKQAKYRTQHQQFIAEGLRTCTTLMQHGHLPIHLFVAERMLPQLQHAVADELITLVTDEVMQKISTAKTPSGILSVFAIPDKPQADQLRPGLVLANITDPGNMGTLMRTATAMDVQSVVIIDGVDPWHPKVVQASAGTIGQLTLFTWSWSQLQEYKKELQLYALVVTDGAPPHTIDPTQALLVIGSEAHGILPEWRAQCDKTITIPMAGKTESLNAAVAGSIALYLAFAKS